MGGYGAGLTARYVSANAPRTSTDQTLWLGLGHSMPSREERKGHLIGLLPSQLHLFNTVLSVLKKLIFSRNKLLSALNSWGSSDLLTVSSWLRWASLIPTFFLGSLYILFDSPELCWYGGSLALTVRIPGCKWALMGQLWKSTKILWALVSSLGKQEANNISVKS